MLWQADVGAEGLRSYRGQGRFPEATRRHQSNPHYHTEHGNLSMKRYRLDELETTPTRLLPEVVGDRRITHGGIYVFTPGETAHPEHHVHNTDEIFIFIQGMGVLPIDGVDHPIRTGDVVVVEAGEDHHTRSSEDGPLVAAWYLVEPKRV